MTRFPDWAVMSCLALLIRHQQQRNTSCWRANSAKYCEPTDLKIYQVKNEIKITAETTVYFHSDSFSFKFYSILYSLSNRGFESIVFNVQMRPAFHKDLKSCSFKCCHLTYYINQQSRCDHLQIKRNDNKYEEIRRVDGTVLYTSMKN